MIQYREEQLDQYQLNPYFYQLPGNEFLGKEEKEQAEDERKQCVDHNLIRSVSEEYTAGEFVIKQGVLQIGKQKISIDFIEEGVFRDIISIMVFLITIYKKDERVRTDIRNNQKGRLLYKSDKVVQETSESIMEQYYQTMWKYCALQAHRDTLTKGYRKQILGPGYYGMPIEENKAIYTLLYGERIGVTLHPSFQFSPENTICGIACKIGENDTIWEEFVKQPCKSCKAMSKACGYCTFKKERV